MFDVAALMEDSETKLAALENVAELEEQLAQANERMQDMENEFMARAVELEDQIQQLVSERDELKVINLLALKNVDHHVMYFNISAFRGGLLNN